MPDEEGKKDSPEPGANNPAKPGQSNPEGGLDTLKNQLKSQQSDLDQQTKKKDALKDDIVALETAVNKLKQVLGEYTQALPTFTDDFKAMQDYLKNKLLMIDAAIGDTKGDVDEILKKHAEKMTTSQNNLNNRDRAKADALRLYESAKDLLKQKQTAFDSYLQFKADMDKQFKEMKQLKDAIEKEDGKNHQANMYFLIKELKTVLDAINVISQETLRDNLHGAWNDLCGAKRSESEKKGNWEVKVTEFEAEEKALAELKSKRREEITKQVLELNQKEKP